MGESFSPQDFVEKWSRIELKEKAAAQEHFIDLCRLFEHGTPAELDHDGSWFTFEYGATKLGGGLGWADVWKKNHFGWEYKSKDKDLNDAYDQLLQYRESLLNPPLLIVSDINTTVIHTNFTNTVKQEYTIELEELLDHEKRQILKRAFYNPEALQHDQTTERVTEQAAAKFAKLASFIEAWGEDPHETAHFLIQLLFCLFAEDIGILPNEVFTRLLKQEIKQTSEFTKPLTTLFAAMAEETWFGEHKIKLIDGGLFESGVVLEVPGYAMEILRSVSVLDWSNIEPAVLGTLFERSLDPSKRAQLGAHYTSRKDIELVVKPVLMQPLQQEWRKIEAEVGRMQMEAESSNDETQRAELIDGIQETLFFFLEDLSRLRVLDPACGSGNFLYVALVELLDLQKTVITFARSLGIDAPKPSVTPLQMQGIEINAYAHELAEATVWIGYIQWMYQNGYGFPDEPILKKIDSIRNADAVLQIENEKPPAEPEWPEADVIIGNPPYLGSRKMRSILGDDYCNALLDTYSDDMKGMPDLVCYWFEKARRMIDAGHAKRAGLLATQAIRGGSNRQVLERIKETGEIFMAWSDIEWILDGATVHVSIVGFDGGEQNTRSLDGELVSHINPDLTTGVNLNPAEQLDENEGIAFQGVILRGKFDMKSAEARSMLKSRGNPNGWPNSDVVKLRKNAEGIVGAAVEDFVVDFGVDMPIDEAAMYVEPFKYVRENVYAARQEAKQESPREKWWLYARPRKKMRLKLDGLKRYIATPRVAKHRIFVWLENTILPDNAIIVFTRDDDYFFGVLHSRIHEIWSRRMGTQLRDAESGFRYTHTTVFNTFPLPWSPGNEPLNEMYLTEISDAARDLEEARSIWLKPEDTALVQMGERTLTKLYNEFPEWLRLAHERIDKAVFQAYGWPADLEPEEILTRLLELNMKRAGEQ